MKSEQKAAESRVDEVEAEDHSRSAESVPDKEPIIKRALKKTGRFVSVTSASDVVFRDAKRMRPRYPHMWKQVFSVSSWREHFKTTRLTKRSLVADVWTSLITILLAVALTAYGLSLAASPAWQNDVPNINKIGLLVIVLAGVVQALCHVGIVIFKIRNRIRYGAQGASLPPEANNEDPKEK
ncbi:hypothetical protein [Marinobacter gelidimuriae]|jgi:hypothetical protein|uniref:hypothetical protein n=1 Tax=Marinobacter gelidimuriae TaxID=2739064 RepID=UPI00036723A6|nr:hypothetical protein [Marinobacter gelidimuriae]